MAAQRSSDYWRRRFEMLEEAALNKGEVLIKDLEREYAAAMREMESEIAAWYGRFASNNDISLAEARKWLTSGELKELKWDLQEYTKYAEENTLNGLWHRELENASAKWHISRYESLQLQMKAQVEQLYGGEYKGITGLLSEVYSENYYHTAFEIQKGIGVGWDLQTLSTADINKALSKPWAADGRTFSDRLWTNKEQLLSTLQTELTQSFALGESSEQAIKRVQERLETDYNKAARLVRTETAFMQSASQKESFEALDVEFYEILATLDTHTSSVCQELDGKVFPMRDFIPGVTAPPFHPNCRTTTLPYFEGEAGYDSERIAFDEDGNTYNVPADMKYEEWKEKFAGDSKKEDWQDSDKGDIINWDGLNYTSSYTKQQAIDQLKDAYGIEFKDSKKYPIDESLLNDVVGWLDSFHGKYPGFNAQNPIDLPMIINKPVSQMKKTLGEYTYYLNKPGAVELALNGKYHSDVAVFQDYIDRAIKVGWTVPNSTARQTFVHEYGHHVSNSLKWLTGNKGFQHDFLVECIEEFKKTGASVTGYQDMSAYVSKYAAKSESELFAEAFSEYFGGENPRAFAKLFGEKLVQVLKGVK